MPSIHLTPQLRFPDFDNSWVKEKLRDNCDLSSGQTPLRSNAAFFKKGNIPWVKTTDLNNSILVETEEKITDFALENTSLRLNPVGTVFVAMYGGFNQIGRTGLLLIPATSNQALTAVNPNREIIEPRYLLAWLNAKINLWRRIAASSRKDPNITGRDVAGFPIAYPSLPEQQKIADFLTTIDTRLRQLREKAEHLRTYKKGVMQQLFSQQIRFKAEDGGDFVDWEKVKLGDLTYKVGKKNKDNIQYPIYSINNKEGFRPQGDQFDNLDSNERGYDISMYKIVKANTFAYNPARINVGSIGYSNHLNNVIISSLYVCFKTNNQLDDHYLLAYLDSYAFNKAVLRNAEGGVRSYLFYENFSIIKIPLPSLPEQQKIADFLTALDGRIQAVETQIEQTEVFKRGLLQQMFV